MIKFSRHIAVVSLLRHNQAQIAQITRTLRGLHCSHPTTHHQAGRMIEFYIILQYGIPLDAIATGKHPSVLATLFDDNRSALLLFFESTAALRGAVQVDHAPLFGYLLPHYTIY